MKIIEIVLKDLRESLKNKTILIVIFLPILASLFFSMISDPQIEKKFNIGIIEGEAGELKSYFDRRVENFKVSSYTHLEKGIEDMKAGYIDSLIICEDSNNYRQYLDSRDPLTYYFLKDSVNEILEKYLNIEPELNLEVILLPVSLPAASFLPVWITITITMIGILVISGNFAEEKEKRTLAALLISPINKSDIIIAKMLFGLILSSITVFIMCILNGVNFGNINNIFAFTGLTVTASICFTSLGLIIGVFADSQSAARSLGTLLYFPFLFPALIYNLSEFTGKLARFFPAFYLYRGLEKLMYNNHSGQEIKILTFFAAGLFLISYIVFKRMIGNNEL